jgi:hypothetical protein
MEQENTPVALQIVEDCFEIVQNNASILQSDRMIAADFLRQADELRQRWEQDRLTRTPEVTLSTSSTKRGASVTVNGTRFQANERIGIYVHASLVGQTTANGSGAFSTVITVPPEAPPPTLGTSIRAVGQTSGRSAEAPFRTAE